MDFPNEQSQNGVQNAALQNDVTELLEHSAHLGLRKVHVSVDNEAIVLTGTVPSYYLKQVAQETARQLCTDRRLSNDLAVTEREG